MQTERKENHDGETNLRGRRQRGAALALERRADELGIEELYWMVVRLGGRVDDLEEQVRELRES